MRLQLKIWPLKKLSQDGADFADWELGTHGIRIEFLSERGNKKTATFLPEVPVNRTFSRGISFCDRTNYTQVPTAQGWDKIQTIDSLLRKGGWRGQVLKFCGLISHGPQVTPEVRRQIRLVRYQSELVSVTYQDYLQHCR